MNIYNKKISYCYFRDVENVDKSLYKFVGKQFQPYLEDISRYREKHCAAIIFVLCNLWHELEHIPPDHGGYAIWEEGELSPFIAPTRTTQGGCNFSCNGVKFSSTVLWKVMESSSLSKLYVIHRGKFLNNKRLPARLLPRWNAIKILRDEYERFSIKSYYYNKWKLTSSSSLSDAILNKILTTELVEIKEKVPNRDRRKKGKNVLLPLADFLDNEEVTSSASFLGCLRAYTALISLSLSTLSEVTPERLREAEIEFSSTELGKKVSPYFVPFVMGNEISKKNFELSRYEGLPFPLKRVFHLLDDGSLSWGRLYGFPSDFLTRWQKLLLQIDGKPTVQIDVKSCIPQIACMMFSDKDNTQDFYSFPSLTKYGIDRDKIKSMFMSICNSISIKKWIATQKFYSKQDNNINMLSRSDYYDILNEIITTKPFMKYIICNHNMYKLLIKQESDFIISCIKDIMKSNIKFLYNYDCIIVQDDSCIINSVLDIMKTQSVYRWNKEINVDIDRYYINTNDSYINDDDLVVNF